MLGEETKQQEYMLATKNYPPNLDAEQAALVVNVSVREDAISLYKKYLNVLSSLLQREIEYIQNSLIADEVRAIDRKEEHEELMVERKEIDLNFGRIEQKKQK